jgi:hypothetical protein
MELTHIKPLLLLVKSTENEVSPWSSRLNIEQFKCMRMRQAGYFLSKFPTLAKFPA